MSDPLAFMEGCVDILHEISLARNSAQVQILGIELFEREEVHRRNHQNLVGDIDMT